MYHDLNTINYCCWSRGLLLCLHTTGHRPRYNNNDNDEGTGDNNDHKCDCESNKTRQDTNYSENNIKDNINISNNYDTKNNNTNTNNNTNGNNNKIVILMTTTVVMAVKQQ